jgi:general secretion pathway protein L
MLAAGHARDRQEKRATDDAIWPERSNFAKPLRISQTTLLSGDSNKTRPVALVVGEANGLRRKVELPIAVEARLSQVLAYELDRLTPLRADELYYDFRLLSRNAARGTCVVELVAAPKKRVDDMIASAKAMGAEVTRLVLAPNDVDEGIDLLRVSRRGTETSDEGGKRWITPMLAAICALLALALVVYPIFKKRQQVIALLPIEGNARAEAEAASIVQRQLEKQVTEYNHLLKRKHASPIAVQVLEDLSKRLPEDTWAQTFEIKTIANAPAGEHPREVIVQGETGSGAKLLQMTQESTLLKDPVLKAAMTRVAPNAERFHFAGELVSVAAPPGLALTDAKTLGTPIQVMPAPAAGAPSSGVTSPQSSSATPAKGDGAPAKAEVPSAKADAAKTDAPKSEPTKVETPTPTAPAASIKGTIQQAPASPNPIGGAQDSAKKPVTPANPMSPQGSQGPTQNVAPFLQSEERRP